MNQQIRIGDHLIGHDQPCFIVAEMSGNHGQNYDRALQIIHAAAQAGADAVKMQAYTADTITLAHDGPDFRIPSDNSWASFNTLHELYNSAYTPWEWFEPLIKEAQSLGMEAFCSVFDHSSVDYLESAGTSVYKIAAPEITDIALLRKVASTGKPVILSAGLATQEDLQLAADTLRESGCEQFVILKCTTEYPAPIEQANLRTIPHISDTFACLSGLSDHTLDTAVPVAAVCVGASVIEKHFTLDASETVDSFFSLQPEQFSQMVAQIRIAEQALGKVDYSMAGKLSGTANGRRSLYACQSIKAGELFSNDNVRSVRPAYGLHPKHLDALIGTVATRDILFGDRLTEDDLSLKADILSPAAMTFKSMSTAPYSVTKPAADESVTTIHSIVGTIETLFVQSGAIAASSEKSEYRLLDDSLLDSFTKISIFMELEAEFQVQLEPDEMMLERNRSIGGLANLILRKSSEPALIAS